MVAMQRRAAHVAVARASEHGDSDFDAALQPDGDALAGADAARRHLGGKAVGGIDQLAIGEAAELVAHGKRAGGAQRMFRRLHVDRAVAPMASSGVLLDPIDAEQRQDHVGRHIFARSNVEATNKSSAVSRRAVSPCSWA